MTAPKHAALGGWKSILTLVCCLATAMLSVSCGKSDVAKASTKAETPPGSGTPAPPVANSGKPTNTVADLQSRAAYGDMEAQYQLGDRCYFGKEGVSKDVAKALYWWQQAAEQGQPQCQHNLGCAYELGWGVKVDTEQAVRWYRKAADQGFAASKESLNRLQPVWDSDLADGDKIHFVRNKTQIKDENGNFYTVPIQQVSAYARKGTLYAVFYWHSQANPCRKGMVRSKDFISEGEYNAMVQKMRADAQRQDMADFAQEELRRNADRTMPSGGGSQGSLQDQMRSGRVILHGRTPFERQLEIDAIDEATTR